MAVAKNLQELAKLIEKKAAESMQKGTNVKKTVYEEGGRQVQEVVYDVYEPEMYERTGQLAESWDSKNISNGIEIFNTRYDKETGKNVAYTVVTGVGYDFDFEYAGVPRDFITATKNELRDNDKKLKDALRKDLNNNGIHTK